MAYSTATFQATAILLYIHFKTEDEMYEFLSARNISEYLSIPAPTVVKILNKLNTAGLIRTKEGAGGGNVLTRPVAQITMLDVLTAAEQDKPLFKIQHSFDIEYAGLDQMIDRTTNCLQSAEQSMKASLSQTTLLDLIR